MTTVLSLFPQRVRFVNQDGTLTAEAVRAFTALFNRVGGSTGQSNDELAVDMHDDSGIEEIKLDSYRIRDELNQIPPQVQAVQDTTDSGRVEALEAEVAELRKQIQALQQGSTS